MGGYLRHSAHERRVAPRLRFLTSLGCLDAPLSLPFIAASGEDMAGWNETAEGKTRREGMPGAYLLYSIWFPGVMHTPADATSANSGNFPCSTQSGRALMA